MTAEKQNVPILLASGQLDVANQLGAKNLTRLGMWDTAGARDRDPDPSYIHPYRGCGSLGVITGKAKRRDTSRYRLCCPSIRKNLESSIPGIMLNCYIFVGIRSVPIGISFVGIARIGSRQVGSYSHGA